MINTQGKAKQSGKWTKRNRRKGEKTTDKYIKQGKQVKR